MNGKSLVVLGAIIVLLACARPIIAADDLPSEPAKAADNDVSARDDLFKEYRAKTTSDGWKRGAIARTLALTEVIDHNKPVGSIDAHATVRVVAVQGDMLHVSHAGISGWVDSRTVVDVSDLLGLLSLRKEAAEQALQQALAAAGKALDPQTFGTAASWSERLRDASLALIENVPPGEGVSQAQWIREKQNGMAAVHQKHRDRVKELARLSAEKVKLGLARETDFAVARYYLSAAEIALMEAELAGRARQPSEEPAHDEPRGREESKPVLISLLGAVLPPAAGQSIASLELLNPFNERKTIDDKLSILDINARDQSGRQFNVEMQLLAYGAFRQRALYP